MLRETQQKRIEELQRQYERVLEAEGKKTVRIRYALKLLQEFLDGFDPLLLSHREAQSFQSSLVELNKYVPGSILGIIGSLSSFYDYLKKRGNVPVNPFRLIDRIKAPETIPGHIPTEKDIAALLDHLARFTRGKNLREYKRDYKAHVLCELLYSTGMRINEAAACRLEDIDFQNSTIAVHDSKTRQERVAFLNDFCRSVLSVYVEEFRENVLWLSTSNDKDLLFGTTTNLRIWLNEILARTCRELDREAITSHMFRHAFGYHMLRAGCDIRKIQQFLGHRNLDTTSIYTKVDTEALRNILDKYHPRTGRKT